MPLFTPNNINVASTKLYYDMKTSTKINDTGSFLQYESQMFYCNVQLEISGGETDSDWSIGLVQASDKMYVENKYGNSGSAFWELHPLKSGLQSMVNDSDGRQYPFYNLTSSKFEIKRGQLSSSNISLNYEDYFFPKVAWELPYCGGVRLTDVIRSLSFWTWLVAIKRGNDLKRNIYDLFNPRVDNIFILQTMRWHYNLHMNFNPDRPVGYRLQFIKDSQTELPFVLAHNRSIPLSALSPPNCEVVQSLIWYPNNLNFNPEIIVPPKQTIVPWEDWILDMSKDRKIQHSKPKDCTRIGKLSGDQEVGNVLDAKYFVPNNSSKQF